MGSNPISGINEQKGIIMFTITCTCDDCGHQWELKQYAGVGFISLNNLSCPKCWEALIKNQKCYSAEITVRALMVDNGDRSSKSLKESALRYLKEEIGNCKPDEVTIEVANKLPKNWTPGCMVYRKEGMGDLCASKALELNKEKK